MSAAEFRAFQARRPDHERWELLGGMAMMMTPPTIAHNQIASNLERFLNEGLGITPHRCSQRSGQDSIWGKATTGRSPTSESSTPTTTLASASSTRRVC